MSNDGRFSKLAMELGALVTKKNAAYGDSAARTGDIMRILYPDGIAPAQYDHALLVVRVLDKLSRIATDRDALGESPWKDIAGYGLLGQDMSTSGDGSPTRKHESTAMTKLKLGDVTE